ncbi:MAG: hypothetical protein GY757_56995 [bacterium]|nr:hypothetical protein [bacterium]
MRKYYLLLTLLIVILLAGLYCNRPDYDSMWKQVEESKQKGLHESSLESVKQIAAAAKKRNDPAVFLKALIHKIHLIQKLESKRFVKIQKILENELNESTYPVKPVLHSMLAQLYWKFYRENRYLYLVRPKIAKKFKSHDIRTWKLKQIVDKVTRHYIKSLDNPAKAKETQLGIIEDIITKGNVNRRFSPYLYDFLAHRAIDFFMNVEAGLPSPIEQAPLSNPAYLGKTGNFSKLELKPGTGFVFHFHALKYLQELVRFHQKTGNREALLNAELKRLKLVFDHADFTHKKEIYLERLQEMMPLYKNNPAAADIAYQMALFHEKNRPPSAAVKQKMYKLCKDAVTNFPGSPGAADCKDILRRLECKKLSFKSERTTTAHKPFKILLNYKNIPKVFFKVVKTGEPGHWKSRERIEDKDAKKYFPAKPVSAWNLKLPKGGDFMEHTTDIKIDGLDFGNYLLLASDGPAFDSNNTIVAYGIFTVSNIAYTQRLLKNKQYEFHVFHRTTGQPLKKGAVQLWYDQNTTTKSWTEKGERFPLDKNGYFSIPDTIVLDNYDDCKLEFRNGEDRLFATGSYGKATTENPGEALRTFFFTDRAIYRPGQTIYFKGIVVKVEDQTWKFAPLSNYKTTVHLLDVNHKETGRLKLKTNEYGSFSGTFQAPTSRLNGVMTITGANGALAFSVEEYKRQKFQVTLEEKDKIYKPTGNIIIKGKAAAFAGYSIDNAEVKYDVTQVISTESGGYYCWSYQRQVASGVTRTGSDGSFRIRFKAPGKPNDAAAPKDSSKKQPRAYRLYITVDVTDLDGETRSASKSLYMGYTKLRLSMDLPDIVDKDNGRCRFTVRSYGNLRPFIPTSGKIDVYKLTTPDRIIRPRKWEKPDTYTMKPGEFLQSFPYDAYGNEDKAKWPRREKVYSGTFAIQNKAKGGPPPPGHPGPRRKMKRGDIPVAQEKNVSIPGLEQWETGKYEVELTATDFNGAGVKTSGTMTLFSGKSKRLPYPTPAWFHCDRNNVEPGEKAVLYIGSSYRNVNVIYDIARKGRVYKTGYFTLNNSQKRIEIPVTEKHQGGLAVHFTFFKHNRFYQFCHNFEVPWIRKKLDISFETFRNKLIPGEKEQWRIKIRGAGGEKVAAEMVATLYDASLDIFNYHEWKHNFSIFDLFYHNFYFSHNGNWQRNSYFWQAYSFYTGRIHPPYLLEKSPERRSDTLKWFGFSMVNDRDEIDGFEPPRRAAKRSAPIKKTRDVLPVSGKEALHQEAGPIKVRTDFRETVFFKPHLQTTPAGDVVISFTMPDGLARWRMKGFAHTKNMDHGFVFNELVTQKKFMVIPNAPRFFRAGDSLVFTTKIKNLSTKKRTGTARLELLDAHTMQPVDIAFKNRNNRREFKVNKGESVKVSWRIKIPHETDAVVCRVTARAGRISDGEEHAVPILKNSTLLTETLPLQVKPKETKKFTLKKLLHSKKSSTLKHHRVTLEFTSNPVWSAVLALPYLIEYPYECMEQVFSRYYANSLGAYIVKSNPRIKEVFEKWQQAPPEKQNALFSNLEKNRELKSLLLKETPWVRQAASQSRRKQQVANLFDSSALKSSLDRALEKLQKGQMKSGGWPWFKGMEENRYITRHILCGFAHMTRLKVIDVRKDSRIWGMLSKAVAYMDGQITGDYLRLKKEKVDLNKNNLTYKQIHYLYARSYFLDIFLRETAKDAFKYYKKQVKMYWLDFYKNKYLQGMMALSMKRYGNDATAKAIAETLKQQANYSDEMGMYWTGRYGMYWYMAAVETHALLIEVFDEVMEDEETVDKIKLWVLKQKQVRDWRTTKATVEACYALLLRGTDYLEENRPPEITLGELNPVKIEPGKRETGENQRVVAAEAGTGYFKTEWRANEITPEMARVTVKNNNNAPAWGSLYWQYFEDLDKITPAEAVFKLKKKLYVERDTETGPQAFEVKPGTRLRIGERVTVSIQLRVDRDMEFVHMKDMRASGFEPEEVLSGYARRQGLRYYRSIKDASVNFFFGYLPRGVYRFSYSLRVTHGGNFSNGITTIQSMYAPEFAAHSKGTRVHAN